MRDPACSAGPHERDVEAVRKKLFERLQRDDIDIMDLVLFLRNKPRWLESLQRESDEDDEELYREPIEEDCLIHNLADQCNVLTLSLLITPSSSARPRRNRHGRLL